MSPTVYVLLWVCYLLAGVLLLWIVKKLTDWPRARWLSWILRLIAFVVIFTPAKLYQQPEFLVPASMALAMDSVLGREEAISSVVSNLLVSAVACALILVICAVISKIVHSRKDK